jgi:hypothetical protein
VQFHAEAGGVALPGNGGGQTVAVRDTKGNYSHGHVDSWGNVTTRSYGLEK